MWPISSEIHQIMPTFGDSNHPLISDLTWELVNPPPSSVSLIINFQWLSRIRKLSHSLCHHGLDPTVVECTPCYHYTSNDSSLTIHSLSVSQCVQKHNTHHLSSFSHFCSRTSNYKFLITFFLSSKPLMEFQSITPFWFNVTPSSYTEIENSSLHCIPTNHPI